MITIVKETSEHTNAVIPIETFHDLIKFKLQSYGIESAEKTILPDSAVIDSCFWFDFIEAAIRKVTNDPKFRGTASTHGQSTPIENFNRTAYTMQIMEDILLYWKLCRAEQRL